jgi:hypothetical protein
MFVMLMIVIASGSMATENPIDEHATVNKILAEMDKVCCYKIETKANIVFRCLQSCLL